MQHSASSPSSLMPMLIIGGLLFLFGFVTWLNGSLIPFLRIAHELSYTQAYFVTFVFCISYTVLALPSALILRRTGYRRGMALGLAIMVAGALLPLLYGALADGRDPQSAYWIMIPCYLFILFYAVKGHKLRPRGFKPAGVEPGGAGA